MRDIKQLYDGDNEKKENNDTQLYDVEKLDENEHIYSAYIYGPPDTLYEGYRFKVRIEFPERYPYKSPSIAFITKIKHVNVERDTGSICLDIINQNWSPITRLSDILDKYIPGLLESPNPDDPLNSSLACLYKDNPEKYMSEIKEYCEKYAEKYITK